MDRRTERLHRLRPSGAFPGREALRATAARVLERDVIGLPSERGGRYFFEKRRADQNLAVLYVRDGVDGDDEILIDPHPMSPDHTVSVDYLDVSADGSLVAYAVRDGGVDEVSIRLMEVDTREDLADVLPEARYGAVWITPDNRGMFYERYGDVTPRVMYHEIGTDRGDDVMMFGEGYQRHHIPVTVMFARRALAAGPRDRGVIRSDGGARQGPRQRRSLQGRSSPTAFPRTGPSSRATESSSPRISMHRTSGSWWLTRRPRLWRTGRRSFPSEMMSLCRPRPLVVAASPCPISEMFNRVWRFMSLAASTCATSSSTPLGRLAAPPASGTVTRCFSPSTPSTCRALSIDTISSPGRQDVWAAAAAPVAPAAYEVEQVWFSSSDGTSVPMFVVHATDFVRDGSSPTLLTGYGGFNNSMTPGFSTLATTWLESGGVFAVANLRGGGEFGEAWHRAGMLESKQNVFDDFIGAAEFLIAERYTSAKHLAIRGGSNGGLLVGAVSNQRPDLFGAVVCTYPLLDMVRYHQFLVASFWVPEYGSSEDPEQFGYIHAYSPYHNVTDGGHYPATLYISGDGDTRVAPLHARKMAALMQARNGSGNPVLLRYYTQAGHSGGQPVSQQIDDMVDTVSFMMWRVG